MGRSQALAVYLIFSGSFLAQSDRPVGRSFFLGRAIARARPGRVGSFTSDDRLQFWLTRDRPDARSPGYL